VHNSIEIKGLELSFGIARQRHKVLDNVEFNVLSGEAFGLVGESGCGKSTVLRCICGLYKHWTGEVVVDGVNCRQRRGPDSFLATQMVFQDPYGSLHPRHTVNTILSEPLKIHKMTDIEEKIATALSDVGLNDSYRFRFPHQLSGGQRQRIAIARALVLDPKILLLDEPTSALDVSVQAEILNLIKDLQDKRGLTLLLVSHDMGVMAHMCSRVAVMHGGRLVEQLSVEQLRGGEVEHAYTKHLLDASQGYDREKAHRLLAEAEQWST
jgi:peptide/nickel transport system ATP-binding protein